MGPGALAEIDGGEADADVQVGVVGDRARGGVFDELTDAEREAHARVDLDGDIPRLGRDAGHAHQGDLLHRRSAGEVQA